MTRFKTFVATGVAPDGRLYAGDLNSIQDRYADLTNLAQTLGVGTLQVGETALSLVRYGAGEGRLTGALRVDGILRGLGGLFAGSFTTTQRDAIAAGSRPYGLVILNTTTNRLEWNSGTDAAPVWRAISLNGAGAIVFPDGSTQTTAAVSGPTIIRGDINSTGAVLAGTGFTVVRNGLGDYTITFTTPFAAYPIVVATPFIQGGGEWVVHAQVPTTTTARFRTTQWAAGAVSYVDSRFHFIAIAP